MKQDLRGDCCCDRESQEHPSLDYHEGPYVPDPVLVSLCHSFQLRGGWLSPAIIHGLPTLPTLPIEDILLVVVLLSRSQPLLVSSNLFDSSLIIHYLLYLL